MPITQTGHPGQDHSRDPCPWVILNDFGGAFAMGCIGGTIWHGVKGARNSPRGERLMGSISSIKARAPVLGGNFGVWGGLFTTFDCSVKSIRQKEDPWNAICAGFLTGSSLAIRGGPKTAFGAGVMCGILLGVFEGVGVLMQRLLAENNKPVAPIMRVGRFARVNDMVARDSADADVARYLRSLTLLSQSEIEEILEEHAKDKSKRIAQTCLAEEMTELVRGDDALQRAQLATQILFSIKVRDLTLDQVRFAFDKDPRLMKRAVCYLVEDFMSMEYKSKTLKPNWTLSS
ncbi:Tim17p [Malassezia vespertilionis]|uniref:Tim17p n=1 Tax=Malassezia vespertilionis TaxID=2020962 RepID=A0A2N1JA75_9BASI|nr:Tim17p [Malassezia vespertilionis]